MNVIVGERELGDVAGLQIQLLPVHVLRLGQVAVAEAVVCHRDLTERRPFQFHSVSQRLVSDERRHARHRCNNPQWLIVIQYSNMVRQLRLIDGSGRRGTEIGLGGGREEGGGNLFLFTGQLDGLLSFAQFIGTDAGVVTEIVDADVVDVEDVPGAAVGQPVARGDLDEFIVVFEPHDVRSGLSVDDAGQFHVVTRLRRHDRLLHRHFRLVCHFNTSRLIHDPPVTLIHLIQVQRLISNG